MTVRLPQSQEICASGPRRSNTYEMYNDSLIIVLKTEYFVCFILFFFLPVFRRKWKKSLSSSFFQAFPFDYQKKYTFNKIIAIYIVMALIE